MAEVDHHARSESKAWKTLFFVSLINSGQASLAIVGIPSYAKQVELEHSQLSLLLAALPVFAGLAAFCMGSISDIFGRKRLLIAGLCLLGVSLLFHAFAQSFNVLLALRCLTGFATGILMGLPSTLLSDTFKRNRQQSLTGKTLCGYAIGQTIGIPIGIALLDWTTFPMLCGYIGFLALLTLPFAQTLLPKSRSSIHRTKNWIPRYLLQARSTLRNGRFAMLALGSYLTFTALSLYYVAFALWLFDTAKLKPTEIAPMYLGGGLLQVFVFVYLLNAISSLRVRTTISLSLFLNSLLFATAYFAIQNVTTAAVLFALTLGVVSIRIPGMQFLVNNAGQPALKGMRVSVVQTCNHLGKATGSVAASFLFARIEMQQIALLSGIITLICGLFFVFPKKIRTLRNGSPQSGATIPKSQVGEFSIFRKKNGSGTPVAK